MSKLTPELEEFYQRSLTAIDSATCRPHFYNLSHRHQTVFLMKTPLKTPLDKYWPTEPPPRSHVLPYIKACREALICWFKKDKDLWTRIARALPERVVGGAKLATIDELMKNVYFTDCVKCECTESDFRYHQVHTADLNDEFKILERPVLLITIGSTAWDQARELDKFFVGKLSPVYGPYRDLRDDPPQDTEGFETWFGTHQGVADVHGMLFRDKGDKFVIPFTFVRGGTLRDSRLKYLEEGLTALKAHPPVL